MCVCVTSVSVSYNEIHITIEVCIICIYNKFVLSITYAHFKAPPRVFFHFFRLRLPPRTNCVCVELRV